MNEPSIHICYDSQCFSNKKQFQVETEMNDGFLILGEVEVYVSTEGKKQMKRDSERWVSLKVFFSLAESCSEKHFPQYSLSFSFSCPRSVPLSRYFSASCLKGYVRRKQGREASSGFCKMPPTLFYFILAPLGVHQALMNSKHRQNILEKNIIG